MPQNTGAERPREAGFAPGESCRYDTIPTRRTLLERLHDASDDRTWNEFYHTYRGFLHAIALKRGLTPEEAEEVVQTVFHEVAEVFQRGDYDFNSTSFKGWLGQRTKWRILDVVKRRPREAPLTMGSGPTPDPVTDLPDHKDDFESQWDKEWQNHLIRLAMSRIPESPRNIQIFDCLALQEMPVKEVCEIFHISRSNADTIKNRVKGKLREQMEGLAGNL